MNRILEMVVILGLVWICLYFSGCSTIHGLGRDLEKVTSPYVQE